MGFDVLVLQSYLRSSLQGSPVREGRVQTGRFFQMQDWAGMMILVYLVYRWSQPRQGSSGACFMCAFCFLAVLSKCWWVPLGLYLSHPLGSFLLKGSAHALQGCGRQQLLLGSGGGEGDGAFWCHQTPACQVPLTALSDHNNIYEREQGKQVDKTSLDDRLTTAG